MVVISYSELYNYWSEHMIAFISSYKVENEMGMSKYWIRIYPYYWNSSGSFYHSLLTKHTCLKFESVLDIDLYYEKYGGKIGNIDHSNLIFHVQIVGT